MYLYLYSSISILCLHCTTMLQILKVQVNNIFYVVLHLNRPLSPLTNVVKKLHKLLICVGSRGQNCV